MILDKKEFKDGLENLKKNKRVEEHILMYDVYLATKPTQIGTTVLHLLAEVNQLIPSVSLSKSLSNKHLVLHKYELGTVFFRKGISCSTSARRDRSADPFCIPF